MKRWLIVLLVAGVLYASVSGFAASQKASPRTSIAAQANGVGANPHAGTGGDPGGPLLPGDDPKIFQSTMPIAGNAGSALGGLMGACSQLDSALAGVGQLANAGANSSLDKVCGNTYAPDTSNLQCDSLSSATVAAKKKQLSKVKDALSCEKDKLDAVEKLITELQAQGNMVNQATSQVRSMLNQSVQNWQKEFNDKLKTPENDRTQQQQQLQNNILPRIKQALTDTQSMIDAMNGNGTQQPGDNSTTSGSPGEVGQFNDLITKLNTARQAFVEAQQKEAMAITANCFNNGLNTKLPQLTSETCPKDVDSKLTPKNYLLCVYWDYLHNKSGAEVSDNASPPLAKTSQDRADQLAGLFETIFSNAPNIPQPGSTDNPQSVQAFGNQPTLILTPSDIQRIYGSQLASFDLPDGNGGKGVPVSTLFMFYVNSCFAGAQNQVAIEVTKADSKLGVRATDIQEMGKYLRSKGDALITKYKQRYANDWDALTLTHLPATGYQGCTSEDKLNVDPQTQFNCMKDLQQKLQHMVAGDAAFSQNKIIVKSSSDPTRNIPVACNGLSGCVTSLTATDQNLTNEINRIKAREVSYAQDVYQQANTMVHDALNLMGQYSTCLAGKLERINNVLSIGLRIGSLNPSQFQATSSSGSDGSNAPGLLPVDKNNLPTVPADMLSFLGGNSSPKLYDLNSEGFTSSLNQISDKLNSQDRDRAKAEDALTSLTLQYVDCEKEKVKTQMALVTTGIAALSDCITKGCPNDSPAVAGQIFQWWQNNSSQMSNLQQIDPGGWQNLQNGISQTCPLTKPGTTDMSTVACNSGQAKDSIGALTTLKLDLGDYSDAIKSQ